MANPIVAAKKRPKSTKSHLNQMRKQSRIPGVIYGLDREPELVEVAYTDLRTHLQSRNKPIDLEIDGKVQSVIIKVVDKEAVKKDILHIDFLRVNDTHPVVVNVPLVTTGIPTGVKTQGGTFSAMKKYVTIRAKVGNIPETFEIDVGDMAAGTIFYVKDLNFDKGTILTPPKTALFGVSAARKTEAAA